MSTFSLNGRDPMRGTPVEITIRGGVISRIQELPGAAVPADQWVLPGLVDIQVNGYGGTDLNGPNLDPGGVGRVVRSLQALGVTRFCPTICTNSRERMTRSLSTIADACKNEPWIERAVAGMHVEGPYISPEDGPRGAHPREHVRAPDWEEFEAFQRAAGGRIRILTLSPEWPGAATFIERVAASGVVVAIGHTGAPSDAIRAAIAAGARLSTHLGNGAHAMLPRHPNYIWEQLAADELSASIIVDGQHLPPSVVKTFVRTKGVNRTILVSDAVALAGMPPGDYEWLGLRVTVSPEGRISLPGTPYLAGAALDLTSAVSKVMAFADVSVADAVTMTSTNPARLLGVAVGTLAEGARADLVVMRIDASGGRSEILRTMVGGETVGEANATPRGAEFLPP